MTDRRYFFSRSFTIKEDRGVPNVQRQDQICLRVYTPGQVILEYHSNSGNRAIEKIWNNATNVRFYPEYCHIRGELAESKKGRRFCISVQEWADDRPSQIYCYLEPWHTIDETVDPCTPLDVEEAMSGEGAQDDGEWHGSGD